jgi:hypothetical protein
MDAEGQLPVYRIFFIVHFPFPVNFLILHRMFGFLIVLYQGAKMKRIRYMEDNPI